MERLKRVLKPSSSKRQSRKAFRATEASVKEHKSAMEALAPHKKAAEVAAVNDIKHVASNKGMDN